MIQGIKNIFIHCSDSNWGEVQELARWHQARGWKQVGYHYIILNGRPFRGVKHMAWMDGAVEPGHSFDDDPIFRADEAGTHVAGRNSTSLGICLIGTTKFTRNQYLALQRLLDWLLEATGLTWNDVLGHCEDPNTTKTCPNIPMDSLRQFLSGGISIQELEAQQQAHVAKLGLEE